MTHAEMVINGRAFYRTSTEIKQEMVKLYELLANNEQVKQEALDKLITFFTCEAWANVHAATHNSLNADSIARLLERDTGA